MTRRGPITWRRMDWFQLWFHFFADIRPPSYNKMMLRDHVSLSSLWEEDTEPG